ncbi:MAG TPA: hypothetical protein VIY55_12575 [Acetobacteraceae bacterium]
MAHRQNEDGGAETHALGDGGDPGEGNDRLVERQLTGELGAGQDDVLADPDVGEPQRLGLEGEAADQGGGGAFTGVGEVDAVVHVGPLVSVGLPTQDVAKRAQVEIAIRWCLKPFSRASSRLWWLGIKQMVLDTVDPNVEPRSRANLKRESAKGISEQGLQATTTLIAEAMPQRQTAAEMVR